MSTLFPGLQLANLFWSTVLFTAIYVLMYRHYIFSLFDPFNIPLVTAIFASVLMVNTVEDRKWWLEFFSFQLAFFLGFSRNKLPKDASRSGSGTGKAWFTSGSRELDVLEGATALLFFLALGANLYLGATAGFPIFDARGGAAKVDTFVGGLGAVRRLNDGAGLVIPCAALVLYGCGRHRKCWLSAAVVELMASCLSGSKGPLLMIALILASLGHHPTFRALGGAARLRKWTRPVMIGGVMWAVAVLYIEGSAGVGEAVGNLLVRLLFYGDLVLYYYHPEVIAHFAHYGPVTYLIDLFNPILGFFRVVPYREPLGYTMVKLLAGSNAPDSAVGPNTCFYVAGHIYFGAVGGFFYSMIIGYAVSFVRQVFFCRRRLGVIAFVALLVTSIHIVTLPLDVPYFVTLMFDSFIPAGGALVISYLAVVATAGSPARAFQQPAIRQQVFPEW